MAERAWWEFALMACGVVTVANMAQWVIDELAGWCARRIASRANRLIREAQRAENKEDSNG